MNQEITKILTDENIINFNNKFKLYPEFIIQNLLDFRKKDNYVSVKSNMQIKRIINDSNKNQDLHYAYLNLLSLLIRHVKFENIKDIIHLMDEREIRYGNLQKNEKIKLYQKKASKNSNYVSYQIFEF